MSQEDFDKVMIPWRKEFYELCKKKDVSHRCVYNADQTGLFYQKVPNSLYVRKGEGKSLKGKKQMKDKTCLTVMFKTAADGWRVPLAVIGKSKQPRCFNLRKPPIAYMHQRNSWFDQKITKWWVKNVFWPAHVHRNGEVNAILILDNCSANNIDFSIISKHLTIKFLPPNGTSRS